MCIEVASMGIFSNASFNLGAAKWKFDYRHSDVHSSDFDDAKERLKELNMMETGFEMDFYG